MSQVIAVLLFGFTALPVSLWVALAGLFVQFQ
jgi:hypothetical protein